MFKIEIEKKAELFKKKAISEDSKKISAKPLLSRQKEVVEQAAGESPGHIMISYNKFSRETCLKIKNKLDVKNFLILKNMISNSLFYKILTATI